MLAPYFQETAIHGGVLFNYNFSNWLEYIQYPNNLERPLLEKSITCAILRARTTAHVFDSIPKPKNKSKPKYFICFLICYDIDYQVIGV